MTEASEAPSIDLSPLDEKSTRPSAELATWIMGKVNRWRQKRDSNYSSRWSQYYRIWRGQWDASMKGKTAERSKIITPATQSAVDQTVAEMAEAVFGRGMWFDLTDEQDDDNLRQLEQQVRDNLIEDFANSRLIPNCIEVFYNGSIYGEGIAKRVLDKRTDGSDVVEWVPVKPDNFVIDTAAKTVDEALGCAHETIRPLHEILEKQQSGEYYKDEISSATGFGATNLMKGSMTDLLEIDPEDGVYITEYHGLAPAEFFDDDGDADHDEGDPDADLLEDADGAEDGDEPKYVEVIAIIANGATLLKGEVNPIDRGFVAYQHHRSPDSFFGIGVVEKAYNAQSGLDGEVRARMDALALTTYPIVGVDATRMPKSLSMSVAPGKVYLTNGQPDTIIQPISFGSLQNASFQQSGDMERYVQVATGATDPAKPVNANTTASGQSQQSAAFIKRAKLTMQTVDSDFLTKLIRKTLLAYNQLMPERYPHLPDFEVNSTMSIMAREYEQMQMTNLLAIIPQESPAFPIILKGIIENYSGPSKDKIIAAIEASMKPDPAQQAVQQHMQQIQLGTAQATMEKTQAERDEVKSRAGLNTSKSHETMVKAQLAPVETQIQAHQAMTAEKGVTVQARQTEIAAAKHQIDHHHKNVEHVHRKVENALALRAQQSQEKQSTDKLSADKEAAQQQAAQAEQPAAQPAPQAEPAPKPAVDSKAIAALHQHLKEAIHHMSKPKTLTFSDGRQVRID